MSLPNEKVLDSSVQRNSPLKFMIGLQQGLPILESAILCMTVGEKAHFKLCKSDLKGSIRIPKNIEEFLLEIELIESVAKKPPLDDIPIEEKAKLAEECKVKGNEFFKQKNLKEASNYYKEGLSYLDSIVERKNKIKYLVLWSSLQLNLCVCLNSFGAWNESKRGCDRAIKYNRDNPKAHYLRGIAEKSMCLYDEALSDFEISLAKNPSDERIKYEIQTTKELKKQSEERTKKSLGKLFKKESLYSEKEELPMQVPKYDPNNPKVFMDLQYANEKKKIVIELYEKLGVAY